MPRSHCRVESKLTESRIVVFRNRELESRGTNVQRGDRLTAPCCALEISEEGGSQVFSPQEETVTMR